MQRIVGCSRDQKSRSEKMSITGTSFGKKSLLWCMLSTSVHRNVLNSATAA